MTNKTHWEELDILRGLAAILMIVNHVGYKTLDTHQIDGGLSANILFASSFAPVLFFFITGVGYGIQSSPRKKASRWYPTFNKAVILFLADLLMRWSGHNWLGLDFLGFIGLSILVLEFVRSSRTPLTYCIVGFTSIFLMRYLLGPYIHSLGYDQQMWGLLGWTLGTSSTPGVSYPLSPWMAYPFAGYLIGFAAMHYKVLIEKRRLQVAFGLLILGCFPSLAGIIISQKGTSSFFRWGTVALGFYVVSFAVILFSLAWSLAMRENSRLKVCRKALLLKGISSLAVVPVHYFLLDLVGIFKIKELGLFSFCMLSIAILTISFMLARSIEKLSGIVGKIQNQKVVWFCLASMFLLAFTVVSLVNRENDFLVMFARAYGQIMLCLLLVVTLPLSGLSFASRSTSHRKESL